MMMMTKRRNMMMMTKMMRKQREDNAGCFFFWKQLKNNEPVWQSVTLPKKKIKVCHLGQKDFAFTRSDAIMLLFARSKKINQMCAKCWPYDAILKLEQVTCISKKN